MDSLTSDLILNDNTKIYQNKAGGDGGGIYSLDSTLLIFDRAKVFNNKPNDIVEA